MGYIPVCNVRERFGGIMKGEIKLWTYNRKTKDWELLKNFHVWDNIITRSTWLEVYRLDNPKEFYVLAVFKPKFHPAKEDHYLTF
jgi:hypothetical protein